MKLSQWAKKQGIAYLTAFRWFKSGKLPVKAEQTLSGTILVYENEEIKRIERNIIYCRVSNHERKDSLNSQVERCEQFCLANGWVIFKSFKEIASGMNDNRKELWKMLDSKPSRIIIENKDRLTRFGFNYLERLLKELGCEIIVLNVSTTDEDDLIKDLVSIVTSFCCKLYGLRRSKNKIAKIKEVLLGEQNGKIV
jgi:predicted site-specific integrase-resolvase